MKHGFLLALALSALPAQGADYTCPASQSSGNLETFRTEMIRVVQNYRGEQDVAKTIERCFPAIVPACLRRVHRYASTKWANRGEHAMADREMEMRLPPKEMIPWPAKPGWRNDLENLWKAHDPAQPYVLSQREGRSYLDIEAIAKDQGWPVVRYKSRHAGGFDSQTSALMMIRVPGEKMRPPVDYDRYINIALPEDPGEATKATKDVNPIPEAPIPTPEQFRTDKSLPSVFTIVTVQKPKGSDPARVFFSKFVREKESHEYKFDRSLKPETCYSCHPSGLRSISPLGYHVNANQQESKQVMPDEFWRGVKEMNDSMHANMGHQTPIMAQTVTEDGKTRKMYDMGAQGPIYGPIKPLTREEKTENGRTITSYPTRTKEFIVGEDGQSGCAASQKTISVRDIFGRSAGKDNRYEWIPDQPVSWTKVANAMECESCHNGRHRGGLNEKTDFSQIQFKILVDQSMPDGWHHNPLDQGRIKSNRTPVQDVLNNNERMALSSCLQAEFRQERNKLPVWLAAAKCNGAAEDVPAETKSGSIPADSESAH